MLRLKNKDLSFELDVEGFEFDAALNYDDANWLMVKISCSDTGNSWSAVDSCLLTYELKDLHCWVKSLKNTNTDHSAISFLEGELGFEYSKLRDELSVVLNFKFHPKGEAFEYGLDGDEKYSIIFESKTVVDRMLAGLDNLMEKFPERLKHKRGA